MDSVWTYAHYNFIHLSHKLEVSIFCSPIGKTYQMKFETSLMNLCVIRPEVRALFLGWIYYVRPNSLAWQSFPFGFFLVSPSCSLYICSSQHTSARPNQTNALAFPFTRNILVVLCQASLSYCQSVWRDEKWRVKCIMAREKVVFTCDRQAAITIFWVKQPWVILD